MTILLLIRDPLNDLRTGVFHGFGRALARRGHHVTLSALPSAALPHDPSIRWEGGGLLAGPASPGGLRGKCLTFLHDLKTLLLHGRGHQVWVLRDKIYMAALAVPLSRLFRRRLVYWCSFPYPESDREMLRLRRDELSPARKVHLFFRSRISAWFLYHCVLRFCDHAFVVSDRLKQEFAARGISKSKLTAYPLCVDQEHIEALPPLPAASPEPPDAPATPTLCYLGVISRLRRMDFILDVLRAVRGEVPGTRLLIVGDALNAEERRHFDELIRGMGLEEAVIRTGHLPQALAWQQTTTATVGIHALPPCFLHDVSSPTKAVEFLALGVPVVVSPVPDMADIVRESGGGLCAPYEAGPFAEAVLRLLRSPNRRAMGEAGRNYVLRRRTYAAMAENVLEPTLLRVAGSR